eukprot:6907137-Pyramimonas_sp.AAC.1
MTQFRRQAHVVEGVRDVDASRPQLLARLQLHCAEAGPAREAGLIWLCEMQIRSPAVDRQALATALSPNCEEPDVLEALPVDPEIQHAAAPHPLDEGQ